MKIDVMIPTYNRQVFLTRAIESVVKQTSPDWELYVYNDGTDSYDFTKFKNKFKDARIHWIGKSTVGSVERQEKGHIAKIRNYLGRAGKNGLMLWVDDDDYLWPDAVDSVLDYFKKNEAMIIFGRMSISNAHVEGWSGDRERRLVRFPSTDLRDTYARLGTPQIVMKRGVFEDIEWLEDTPFEWNEDGFYFKRLGEKYVFKKVDIWISNAYQHNWGHSHLTKGNKKLEKKRE